MTTREYASTSIHEVSASDYAVGIRRTIDYISSIKDARIEFVTSPSGGNKYVTTIIYSKPSTTE